MTKLLEFPSVINEEKKKSDKGWPKFIYLLFTHFIDITLGVMMFLEIYMQVAF